MQNKKIFFLKMMKMQTKEIFLKMMKMQNNQIFLKMMKMQNKVQNKDIFLNMMKMQNKEILHLISCHLFKERSGKGVGGGGVGVYTRFLGVMTSFRRKWHNSTTINQRGWKYTFSERSLNFLSENVNFMSVVSVV